jgi:copper(I)-binding protein
VRGWRIVEAIAAFALASSPAWSADVSVDNAWFRAMPAHLPAAGYFALHNQGHATITLVGASSPACGMLMLHKSSTENGMSSMSGMASVPVTAGAKVAFAPGGFHLMCDGPSPAMKHGARVPVTLQFQDGKMLVTSFVVKDARGQ